MKTLAVIPARSGSKRIPRKNLYEINGIPMIGRAVRNALESGIFDEIIVSTDSDEIADVAKKFGAKIPRLRSKELSDDFSTTYEVMADVLTEPWIGDNTPDYVCCIYATTPLLKPKHLQVAYERIVSGDYDYVFPAIAYSHPIQRSFRIDDNSRLKMLYPEYLLTRSQDLETTFHDAGQFYWGQFNSWRTHKPIFGPNSSIIQTLDDIFIDIDNWQDLKIAELLLRIENS